MDELYYPCSENNGADQLHGYCEADLNLYFCEHAECWFSRGVPVSNYGMRNVGFLVACLSQTMVCGMLVFSWRACLKLWYAEFWFSRGVPVSNYGMRNVGFLVACLSQTMVCGMLVFSWRACLKLW